MLYEYDKSKVIDNIKTSMEMENQFLTPNDIAILNDFADNKITIEDALNEVRKNIF